MPFCPRVIICEGHEDVRFFKKLIQVRGLPDFRVESTATEADPQGGISKFARKIRSLKAKNINQFNVLSDILLIADNDSSPDANFAQIQRQIEELYPGFAPSRPTEKTLSRPYISVLMLPWADEQGHLEKLCGDAFRCLDRGTANHVDTFMANIRAGQWTESRQAKAWLRSNIAARANDPCCPLPDAFEHKPALIDFNHRSLDRVAEFLKGFA